MTALKRMVVLVVIPLSLVGRDSTRAAESEVKADGDSAVLRWPISDEETGELALDLGSGKPLIRRLAIVAGKQTATLLEHVDPVTYLVVGTRVPPEGRPPTMSPFNVFFDAPAKRPHETFRAMLEPKLKHATRVGAAATVVIDGLRAGPFSGSLEFRAYEGSRLVHIEAVLTTSEDRRAYLYDMGLVARGAPSWKSLAWMDTEGRLQARDADAVQADTPLAVRHRTLIASTPQGSVACFPPPHQYFFARDLTDNLRYVWFGKAHRGSTDNFGFGIRHSESGGGSFAPWFNAPPGTAQRLGMFLLVARGGPQETLREVLRYTHGDRFRELPGHVTFTSHWHMAIAMAALKELDTKAPRNTPDLVKMFHDMNVNVVHLGEFHGDGHPRDPGPLRLAELDALFAECRRLSGDRLLLVPGEEANAYLGVQGPGRHPGHWMLMFPRPVYWTMVRDKDQPFAEVVQPYGTVYHVGNGADMSALLEREHGLAWTAHPRIKASSWAPDGYKHEPFFRADSWLGAAWKALPTDLSRPRLGVRALDLMDDMANWGAHKYVLGEVDVFKIDHTHELYGHMNINYVRLDRVPRFEEGWQPLLDTLRAGQFFTTTGEVLVREFSLGGRSSGQTLTVSADERPELVFELEWTFPLAFAEVISGDGQSVYRDRVELGDTRPFGRRTLRLRPQLTGRRWLRVEAWDVAANGAFTQPVWIEAR